MIGHSTTVLSLMSTLGLFRDELPLLASNRDQLIDRNFKTSNIAPYSANVAFVVYACDNYMTEAGSGRSFLIQLLVNEEPVMIPGCDSLLCPYNEVRDRYYSLVKECNIADICFSSGMPSAGKLSFVIYIVMAIVFSLV